MDQNLREAIVKAVDEYVEAEDAYNKLLMNYVSSNGEPLRLITAEVLKQMQDLEEKSKQAEERLEEVMKAIRTS